MIEADIARLLHAHTEQEKYKTTLVMQLCEIKGLPQSVINEVVSSSCFVFGKTFIRFYVGVSQRITETGYYIDICDTFDELQNSFAGLDMVYLQKQYIIKEF
uniref:Uncharacterized protein n=1 Tax=Amphimedon queenslandica TaxID=400682 RepID=A0A1X7TNM6_AMPQE